VHGSSNDQANSVGPVPTHYYRPDIDGLRAVAVLLVFAFHAGLPGFRGGFIGVDIFFVISGYLISGIIFNGLAKKSFSFTDFYVRRINRILPALLAVVATTALLGWLFLFLPEFRVLGKHVLGSSTFTSNFFLWQEAGYFDSQQKPLLHLWSLAVEEQFYLVWPITAVVLWKSRCNVRWGIIAVVGTSLLVSIWQTRHSQASTAFFLPAGRFWEILAGGLLQEWESKFASTAKPSSWIKQLRGPSSLVGLSLLALSLVIANPTHAWPGIRAVVPVTGTLLVVFAGHGAWVNRQLLGRSLLVQVGLISYPLYLWHWPLLVFARLVNEGEPAMWLRCAILLFAFALAFGTYRLIERPIRFGARKRKSAVLLASLLPVAAVIGLLMNEGYISPRLDSWQDRRISEWGPDWDAPSDRTVNGGRGLLTFTLPGNNAGSVVLYGDSHVQQYWPRAAALAYQDAGRFPTVTLIAYGDCPPIPQTNHRGLDWDGKPWQCDALNRAAVGYMSRSTVRTVVIAAYWERYLTKHDTYASPAYGEPLREGDRQARLAFDRFESSVASLIAQGKEVYIILSNPTAQTHASATGLPRRLAGFREADAVPAISRAEFTARTAWTAERLRQIGQRTGAKVIDPVDFLCGAETCPTVTREHVPIYKDDDHLRAGFVRDHVTYLDQVFAR
jgi:peptidoglycan/LPS O-acetylase OafA/YrhL